MLCRLILVLNLAIATTMAGESIGLIAHGRALLTTCKSNRKEMTHHTQAQQCL